MTDAQTLPQQLRELALTVQRGAQTRRAIHLRVHALEQRSRSANLVALAVTSFQDLVRGRLGQVFQLYNGDILCVFGRETLGAVQEAVSRAKYVFGDDPLLSMPGMEERLGKFVEYYDLSVCLRDFVALLNILADEEEAAVKEAKAAATPAPRERRRAPAAGSPLTPAVLAQLERALQGTDLANMVRRQSICSLVSEQPFPVATEIFISIADLRDAFLPGIDLTASPWLFQHMTESLDKRVLSILLRREDRTLESHISINLNVQSMLSDAFLDFDEQLQSTARQSIILELNKVDVFADLNAFIFAREFAHDRGYKICLDGIDHTLLPYLSRNRLGVDLLKVMWNHDLPNVVGIEDALTRNGSSKIVLARVDSPRAIDWGRSRGINLYQGRLVEQMLADVRGKDRVWR